METQYTPTKNIFLPEGQFIKGENKTKDEWFKVFPVVLRHRFHEWFKPVLVGNQMADIISVTETCIKMLEQELSAISKTEVSIKVSIKGLNYTVLKSENLPEFTGKDNFGIMFNGHLYSAPCTPPTEV
jgi:hypothetical protein